MLWLKQKVNPLSDNPKIWSNTLKQFVGNLPTNYLSVFDHLVRQTPKGIKTLEIKIKFLKNDAISKQNLPDSLLKNVELT